MTELTPEEKNRLYDVIDTWSLDILLQGLQEELEDILAARVLCKLPPFTLEEAKEIEK